MRDGNDANVRAAEALGRARIENGRSGRVNDSEFSPFFAAHQVGLVRAMYLLTGDRSEAEELSQEAFVRIYERWSEVSKMESPVGYLYRTAFNLNRKRLRRLRRLVARRTTDETAGEMDPEARAVSRSDVSQALLSLTTDQREVIILREWLDLTTDDLARVLKISPSAARVRLHRGRQALRDQLGDDYG
jgi:RNA polymerase sigma-70 factor (ECF subfamily)